MTHDIVFLDIDGTILKYDHTYENETVEAIHLLQKKGVKVFLATGRPSHEIMSLSEVFSIDHLITFNGAYAQYEDRELFKATFSIEQIQSFVSLAKENGHELVLYTIGKNYYTNLQAKSSQDFIDKLVMKENFQLPTESSEILGGVLGCTLLGVQDADFSPYEIDTNIHFSQVNVDGAKHAFDIIRKNVNKGVAIKSVLEALNINSKRAVAFGDGMNDKEMFHAVGTSFAMGNCHPDLKSYATNTTTSVDDLGVVNGLKQLGLI